MINVCHRKCSSEGYGKQSSFGVAGTRMAEKCAQHTRPSCGVEGCRGQDIVPHYSGKEIISDVSPDGVKRTAVGIFPTQTSPPSDGSWDSRERERHFDLMSTASTGAVAGKLAAGAVKTPEIDGQKSSIRRNSSVKTEVQVSL